MKGIQPEPALIRTPDYRLRVFVSSTLTELLEEREAVRQAILRLRLAPVMFELGARPYPADELYRAYLTQSHVFVGIYWQSYGWSAPGKKVSGLEDEYGLSHELPRLLYIKEPAPDRDPALTRLFQRFERENKGCYRSFQIAGELKELVENDLAVLLTERFEAAGVRDARRGDSAERPITNVPFPRNSLIGRERELKTGTELLSSDAVALLTLTGPGGSGKSRLALEMAIALRDRFKDGTYFIGLESVSEPGLVIPAMSKVLGVPKGGEGLTRGEDLKKFLRGKQILLVLDNFEHVLEAASAVADILGACPGAKALVTSRAPLHLRAERELTVPPLPIPAVRRATTCHSLSRYAAVRLFVQRAQAVKPDFRITEENARTVAEICRRLDGLPLAIELAAARIRMLSPQALLERMQKSLTVLGSGKRDWPVRQQTLHGMIDWSHSLLSEDERLLFRRLAAFAGGWTFEAADAVCNAVGERPVDVFEGLEKLADLNLVVAPEEVHADLRLRWLETIREFARERLEESDEADQVREAHAKLYHSLVKEAEPHLRGPLQTQWIKRLDADYSNVRAALAWCQRHDVELGMDLCGRIIRYWEFHTGIAEGRAWLEQFIKLSSPVTLSRARVLLAATVCAVYQGDLTVAEAYAEEARCIFQRVGEKGDVARALNELGLIASYQGDYTASRRYLEQSLEIKREVGTAWSIANTIGNLGDVARCQGDHATAHELHSESLALCRSIDDKGGVAISTGNLAHAAKHLGRYEEARTLQRECMRLFSELGDKDGLAESFERLAMLANAEQGFANAARWFGVASVFREQAGTLASPADRLEYEKELNLTRGQLTGQEFDAAWTEGETMTLDRALAEATSLTA